MFVQKYINYTHIHTYTIHTNIYVHNLYRTWCRVLFILFTKTNKLKTVTKFVRLVFDIFIYKICVDMVYYRFLSLDIYLTFNKLATFINVSNERILEIK